MNTVFRVFMICLLVIVGFFWYRDAQLDEFSGSEQTWYIVLELFFAGLLVYATLRDSRNKQEGL